MADVTPERRIRLGLPKGRMYTGLVELLAEAGVQLRQTDRGYRPAISLPEFEVKVLKPQNIIEMLVAGSREVGFAGADWVAELGAELTCLLDTGLDPVRLVAAAPQEQLERGPEGALRLPGGHVVVAAEYPRLTKSWIAERGLDATFVRSFGATEVFPPEDADCIIDITASGATLRANGLTIFDELMRSSTRLYAHPAALEQPAKREAIERLVMLLQSVLEARRRVMVEVNVSGDDLDAVIAVLPCMREPTVSTLHRGGGFAVKVAVPRAELPRVIPAVKAAGGTDIVVTNLTQIVP